MNNCKLLCSSSGFSIRNNNTVSSQPRGTGLSAAAALAHDVVTALRQHGHAPEAGSSTTTTAAPATATAATATATAATAAASCQVTDFVRLDHGHKDLEGVDPQVTRLPLLEADASKGRRAQQLHLQV